MSLNIQILASGNCLNVTSLSDVEGSVLSDNLDTTCFAIPTVAGVTPLVEIQLTSNCRDTVENDQVRLFCS